MAGFGSQRAGSTSAGLGAPAIGQSMPGVVLRDPATQAMSSSRGIDSVSRDYLYDVANGRLIGMDDVRQLVQLALSTEIGSSAMRSLGNELRRIDRITSNFERRVNDAIAAALSDLIARKVVALQDVVIQRFAATKTFVRVEWRDLTTGVEHSTLV